MDHYKGAGLSEQSIDVDYCYFWPYLFIPTSCSSRFQITWYDTTVLMGLCSTRGECGLSGCVVYATNRMCVQPGLPLPKRRTRTVRKASSSMGGHILREGTHLRICATDADAFIYLFQFEVILFNIYLFISG